MNILFIENGLCNPFNANNGGSQRTNLLLQACSKIANVDVITFYNEKCVPDDNTYTILYAGGVRATQETRWLKFIRLCYAASPRSFATLNIEKEKIIDSYYNRKRYDYIVVRYVNQAVECGLLKYGKQLVVDIDDSPYDSARRDVMSAKTLRNRLFYKILATFAKKGLNKFTKQTHICFFSNYEQALENHGVYLPNVPYFSVRQEELLKSHINKGRLLFVGDFCYFPNIDGIKHFMKNIYPIIKTNTTYTSIHIVGKIFDYDQEILEKQGATVMGYVEDLAKEYSEAEIVIIPLYTGAGTCIKFLEAMQMHRPIITTPVGMRGYNSFFSNGEDYILAENDRDFALQVCSLLDNPQHQQRIVNSASKKINQIFSKEYFYEIISETLV